MGSTRSMLWLVFGIIAICSLTGTVDADEDECVRHCCPFKVKSDIPFCVCAEGDFEDEKKCLCNADEKAECVKQCTNAGQQVRDCHVFQDQFLCRCK